MYVAKRHKQTRIFFGRVTNKGPERFTSKVIFLVSVVFIVMKPDIQIHDDRKITENKILKYPHQMCLINIINLKIENVALAQYRVTLFLNIRVCEHVTSSPR